MSDLPEPKMRNAVSFTDRPQLTRGGALHPNSKNSEEPLTKLDLTKCKPANEQDSDDFARADSEDSDDYDGVPRTEEIPMVIPVSSVDDCDKMEVTLEEHSVENDLPLTKTVDDTHLQKQPSSKTS